jgi:hypothetical protein
VADETMTEEALRLLEHFPQEDLCDELAAHFRISEALDAPMIHHPLVVSIFVTPMQYGQLNHALAAKKEWLAKQEAEGNWMGYVYTHERPYRLDAFNDVADRMTDKEYWEIAASLWTDTENMHEFFDEWGDILHSGRPGFAQHFMDEDDRQKWLTLPDVVTVHRGYNEHGSISGWSWTLSLSVAEFFAKRYVDKGEGTIATASVPKECVIAYLSTRGEDEAIVDPSEVGTYVERKV